MTETIVQAPSGAQRLLGAEPDLALPALPVLDVEALIALVEAAGLTGRGGAGFPTARKLTSVSGHSPVIVGNAMEGEPLSLKDAVLLSRAPGLVVAGLALLGSVLGARRVVLALGPEVPDGPVRAAAAGSMVEVRQLEGGFVAGQESALVNQINGRPALPGDGLVPVFRRGVGGRPTLVLNAETLAQLALLVRHGAAWFRSQGTPDDPGTFLASVSASRPGVVGRPGVIEVPRGTPLRAVLVAAGVDFPRVAGVLVGGFHGAWVPPSELDVLLTRTDLARLDASPGAGVIHVLDRDSCPLKEAAAIAGFLADQGAGQCGPCVNGLPRMAGTLHRLAVPGAAAGLVAEVDRLRRLVHGRGACAHPDGTARFVASTMRVFADHVEDHLEGACRAPAR